MSHAAASSRGRGARSRSSGEHLVAARLDRERVGGRGSRGETKNPANEEPRQCTTDERWWTAGRITQGYTTRWSRVQLRAVVEWVVNLVVGSLRETVLPLDVAPSRLLASTAYPSRYLTCHTSRVGALQCW